MCEMVRKVMQEISDIIALVDVNVCIKGTAGSSEECQTTLAQLASSSSSLSALLIKRFSAETAAKRKCCGETSSCACVKFARYTATALGRCTKKGSTVVLVWET